MTRHDWIEELPAAVTLCDREGVILEMNARAALTFAADGGKALIGRNVLDCHPPAARAKLERLLASGETNVYTIEKRGVKKLIWQSPWSQGGEVRGVVELSIELPRDVPHFLRPAT
jgi:PAS domain-containing protein